MSEKMLNIIHAFYSRYYGILRETTLYFTGKVRFSFKIYMHLACLINVGKSEGSEVSSVLWWWDLLKCEFFGSLQNSVVWYGWGHLSHCDRWIDDTPTCDTGLCSETCSLLAIFFIKFFFSILHIFFSKEICYFFIW